MKCEPRGEGRNIDFLVLYSFIIIIIHGIFVVDFILQLLFPSYSFVRQSWYCMYSTYSVHIYIHNPKH